jgi:hypothetical protein
MNIKLSVLTLAIIFFFLRCAGSKKMKYEFPDTMNETVKTEYLRQCEKGAVLYDINCAQCHTKNKKIPDFTAAQIYGYDIRMSNSKHESAISAQTVTTEELGYIMSFLSYKKKSGLKHVGTHPDN